MLGVELDDEEVRFLQHAYEVAEDGSRIWRRAFLSRMKGFGTTCFAGPGRASSGAPACASGGRTGRRRWSPPSTGSRPPSSPREVSHDGDARLARHVANARRRERGGGVTIQKETPDSPRRIDAALAAVLAFEAAADAGGPSRGGHGYGFHSW